jgi:hypothetical protein
MAAHPGRPELALVEHLAALRAVAGPLDGSFDTADGLGPDAASGE